MKKPLKIIILVLIVFGIFGLLFLYFEYRNKLIMSGINKNYAENVITIKKTNIYLKEKDKISAVGNIAKGITFSLDKIKNLKLDNKYFKIKDSDYYVYYADIKPNKPTKIDNEYKKYLVFNSNVITKKNTQFYLEDKEVLVIENSFNLPLIKQDDKYYYVFYLNQLLAIKKDNIKELIENSNTDVAEASYISVINYVKLYQSDSEKCSEDTCVKLMSFKGQIDALKDSGYYTITTEEYKLWLNNSIRLKEKAILLTLENEYLIANDILNEYDFEINKTSSTTLNFKDENNKSTKENNGGDIPRYNIKNNTSLDDYKKMLAGEYISGLSINDNLPALSGSTAKIAVLNYHFFYDGAAGEVCGENICLDTAVFRQQLQYLKDNGYKTLTIKEFVDWMYGNITLPSKSVLITVDDGAMGTSKINGNHLIRILEEYNMHATLFLISSWWHLSDYQSPNLDVESHGHDLHISGTCGSAKILCLNQAEIVADLKLSINTLGTSNAFCYPFYRYDEKAIQGIKEAGFKVAFIGGSTKASQASNKYLIPRYPIYKSTTFEQFKNMVR